MLIWRIVNGSWNNKKSLTGAGWNDHGNYHPNNSLHPNRYWLWRWWFLVVQQTKFIHSRSLSWESFLDFCKSQMDFVSSLIFVVFGEHDLVLWVSHWPRDFLSVDQSHLFTHRINYILSRDDSVQREKWKTTYMLSNAPYKRSSSAANQAAEMFRRAFDLGVTFSWANI